MLVITFMGQQNMLTITNSSDIRSVTTLLFLHVGFGQYVPSRLISKKLAQRSYLTHNRSKQRNSARVGPSRQRSIVQASTATLLLLIQDFGLRTCSPLEPSLEWDRRELKPILILIFVLYLLGFAWEHVAFMTLLVFAVYRWFLPTSA